MSDAKPAVSIQNVSKRFGGVAAVDGVSLDIAAGEFFSLLGPSGCGKTTLMRLIAGFERPGAGAILIEGVDMAEVPPHLRPVNMMFQSYALFPHLTVQGNVAFGLKQQGLDRGRQRGRTDEMLALVKLEGFADRKPHQLSGGQRQRVALARALARAPKVLLLDEPLAALDKKLRQETQGELKRIQAETGTTFIVVTHDQEEAMALSDRMAIMREGRIEQVGAPQAVYDRPANRYVAGFVGEVNLLPAALRDAGGVAALEIAGVEGLVPTAEAPAEGGPLTAALRPERARLAAAPDGGAPYWMPVRIEERAHLGPTVAYRLRTPDGRPLRAAAPAEGEALPPGSNAWLGFRAADLRILAA